MLLLSKQSCSVSLINAACSMHEDEYREMKLSGSEENIECKILYWRYKGKFRKENLITFINQSRLSSSTIAED